MRLGYNTNGLTHHELQQAIDLLATIGYQSVAITLDHHSLNPFSKELPKELTVTKNRLKKHAMRCVIETGARFLLDPGVKHEPTLLSPDPRGRQRRIDFLCKAIDVAAELEADAVSFWSGVLRSPLDPVAAMDRLKQGLLPVIDYAKSKRVVLGFEPEPGMLIDRLSIYEHLVALPEFKSLLLTLDIGHLHCQGEIPLAEHIDRSGPRLVNVHIEDMRAGVHEHLMFGEGEIDFPPVLRALKTVGYSGGIHVELSRHSHEGPQAAKQAFDFLSAIIDRLDTYRLDT